MASVPSKAKPALAVVFSGVFYWLLAYYLERTDSWWLQLCFAGLFVSYFFLLKLDWRQMVAAAVFFRLLFIVSVPALSDDFYRFIWDGLLWHSGIHPFTQPPSFYMLPGNEVADLTPELFASLNSGEYFTIYPPFHQLVFWLGTFGYKGNVLQAILIMRLILLIVETAFLLLLPQWLKKENLPLQCMGLYALNPLVIMEVTGNLHFEGMLAFFLVLSIYHLQRQRWMAGSIGLAASVATKLTSAIAGPALMLLGGKKSWWLVVVTTTVACLLFFGPMFHAEWLSGQVKSLELYFRRFEFNASVYYLLREVGYWQRGFNTIATLGPKLALWGGGFILLVSGVRGFRGGNVWQTVSIVWLVYYLAATTVHPWYVVPLVALAAFSGYRFPVVWSYTILWTYWGYTVTGYITPWPAIMAEYTIVLGVFVWEVLLTTQTRDRIASLLKG